MVTTSIAYYTATEFRRNSEFVAGQLQQSREILDNYGKPRPFIPRKIEIETRDNVTETMKDLWNHEIIRGVNWVYGIQWNAIGKRVENSIQKAVTFIKDSTSTA